MPRKLLRLLPALALTVGMGALTVSPAEAAREPLVQGVVSDSRGHAILGVEVKAVNEEGDVVASDLSYENTTAAGDPQPGYFALHVGSNGSYDVILKKTGYETARLSGVDIRRGSRVASLGSITLKKLPVATKTVAVVTNEVRVGDQAKVKVTVSPASKKPVGDVVILNGRKQYGSAKLKATQNGVVTVTLQQLDKGSYDLKAVFKGATGFDGSSDAFDLEVKAKKRRHNRPNAAAWVA